MTLVNKENKEVNQYELEVSVEASVFDEACNKAYKKNVKRISVPGFRVGKAPRQVIEKRYGEGVFYEDAIELSYPAALTAAIEEAGLDVVAVESLEPTEVSAEKGFSFKALCIVKPEVDIDDYKNISVTKEIPNITDEDIDREIKQLQERNGRMINVEDRAAEDGDTVIIDFDGYVDDEAFDGGKAEHFSLKLGSGQFIPGFEDQIVGKQIGDEFDVHVTFPEDYHVENLAGKPSVFHCKLHGIKTVELPDLDDELAKDVSEFDTLDELKADIREKLETAAVSNADNEVEKQLVDALVEHLKAEIPPVMFEKRIDDLVREFEHRISMQGLSMDLYQQYTGMTKEQIRDQFQEQAERQVKVRLALEKIADLENFEASAQEIEDEFSKLSEQYHMELEELKKAISAEDLKKDIAVDKAMKFVTEQANVTEVEKTSADQDDK